MIEIKTNPADMARVRRLLDEMKSSVPKVVSRALNKTLTGVKTDASAEIRTIITAKKAAVDATFSIGKATPQHLSAVIVSRGKPLPLIDFGARQTVQGVSVQVKKTSPRTVVSGAFIRTMRSGHKGVFWREWHAAPRKPVNKNLAYAKLPKRFRLPMAERFGPRVPDILSNEPVIAAVLRKADDRLHKNLEHETDYELSRMRAM